MGVGKRKREALPDEVEVDINAAEPLSKKELRRAKKGKAVHHKPGNSDDEREDPEAKAARAARSKALATHRELDQTLQEGASDNNEQSDAENETGGRDRRAAASTEAERKDVPGVWIGNLPWTVTKAELMKFVSDQGKVLPTEVTRIHMPGPTAASIAQARHKKLTNRGFAYVDFKTETARDAVIAVSEKLLAGRAVLIKNSKSYEGRPAQEERKVQDNGKPPSARIFIGNLSFDATEDDLRDNFAKCGLVKSVFIATFPDSGNCKGYAWVTFEEVASAEKAIRGWVELMPDDDPEDSDDEGEEKSEPKQKQKTGNNEDEVDEASPDTQRERRKKKAKPRKWFVNRLKGRQLRMEFAEDPTTRYVKRFGKKKEGADQTAASTGVTTPHDYNADRGERGQRKQERKPRAADDEKPRKERPEKVVPKIERSKDKAFLTGAVMEGKGKKVTF